MEGCSTYACCDSRQENEGLECEICCKLHHITCVGVERTLYSSLKKYRSENIVFICPTCLPFIRYFRPPPSTPPSQTESLWSGPQEITIKNENDSLTRESDCNNQEDPIKTKQPTKEFKPVRDNRKKKTYLGKNRRKKAIRCEECDVRFSDLTGLENHNVLNHSSCREEIADRTEVVELQVCEEDKPVFECKVCHQTFDSVPHLKLHMLNDHSKPRLQCNLCPVSYSFKKDLKRHMETKHLGLAVEKNRELCEICGSSFVSVDGLKRHLFIHTGLKPHMCSVCGKSFRLKEQLVKHTLSHTGNFKHQCPTCGKLFFSLYNLQIHERIHTGDKPFQCNYCDLRFRVKCSLKDHLKQHTGEGNKIKKDAT